MSTTPHMLTEKFIPSICQPKVLKKDDGSEEIVPAQYEGHVMLRIPDYDERQQFFLIPEMDDVINAGAKAKADGGNIDDAIADNIDAKRNMAIIANVRRQIKDWVLEVSIKRLDDGQMFENMDHVRYDSEVGAVTQEIIIKLLGRYRWGNQSVPKS